MSILKFCKKLADERLNPQPELANTCEKTPLKFLHRCLKIDGLFVALEMMQYIHRPF